MTIKVFVVSRTLKDLGDFDAVQGIENKIVVALIRFSVEGGVLEKETTYFILRFGLVVVCPIKDKLLDIIDVEVRNMYFDYSYGFTYTLSGKSIINK